MAVREFDLSPFRGLRASRTRPLAAILVLIGVVFTTLGLVLAWILFGEVTRSGFGLVVGVFAVGGWAPSMLILAVHPFRWTRGLEVSAAGLRLTDSTGRVSSYPWDLPGLMIKRIETIGGPPAAGVPPLSVLVTSPPLSAADVGVDAWQAIVEQATAVGFTESITEFDGPARGPSHPSPRRRETLLVRRPVDSALPSARPGPSRAGETSEGAGPFASANPPDTESWSIESNDARMRAANRSTNLRSMAMLGFLFVFGAAFLGLAIVDAMGVGLAFGLAMIAFGLFMGRSVVRSFRRQARTVTVTRDQLEVRFVRGDPWRRRWNDPRFAVRLRDYRVGFVFGPPSLASVPCGIESADLYAGLSPEAMEGIRRAAERAGIPVVDGEIGHGTRAIYLGQIPKGVRPVASPHGAA